MRGRNIILVIGVILLANSILLAIIMNVTGEYEPLTISFGISGVLSIIFIFISMVWRSTEKEAKKRGHACIFCSKAAYVRSG